jgi:hypothetical protein
MTYALGNQGPIHSEFKTLVSCELLTSNLGTQNLQLSIGPFYSAPSWLSSIGAGREPLTLTDKAIKSAYPDSKRKPVKKPGPGLQCSSIQVCCPIEAVSSEHAGKIGSRVVVLEGRSTS